MRLRGKVAQSQAQWSKILAGTFFFTFFFAFRGLFHYMKSISLFISILFLRLLSYDIGKAVEVGRCDQFHRPKFQKG